VFTPEERAVYRCPVTNRAYDPLAVKRALDAATAGRFNALCGEKTDAARASLTDAARKAFGLKAIDPQTGDGVLDATVWDALCRFTGYLRGKGNRAKPTPQASPCTGSRGPRPTTIGSP